jgi:CubicO group peptidase (beta-lactamase class C family)
MDANRVLAAMQSIRDGGAPGVDSLLVVRNGRLVAESYFNGFTRETLHDLRSTGKSFISALAGIAVEQRLIAVDDPISRYFPGFDNYANMDADKRAISVLNLLNMNSGLSCDDWQPGSPGQEEKMYDTRDWVKFALDLRMLDHPGTTFRYCTAGVMLLGHVVSRASGQSLDDYAQTWLHNPLGIRDSIWRRSPDGQATGGTGYRLRPRDAAKLGALYANEGVWNGARVISETWVMRSRERASTIGDQGYGYLWWKRTFTGNAAPLECFHTSGNGGNYVFVFPALELVVTYTGSNYNSSLSDQPLRLVPAILSAVQ